MSASTDFRTDTKNGLSFYVYDDLNGKKEIEIYKYDTIKEAMEKYKSLPKEWMSALGVSINDVHMVDLIHRLRELDVMLMDHERIESFSNDKHVKKAVDELKENLPVFYQLISGIHPRCAVISSIENKDVFDPYLKNKVLYIPRGIHSSALFASINELYVEGRGWMDARHFLRSYANDAATNMYPPIIRRINATYKEVDTGYVGQCDMTPYEYAKLLVVTKEYTHSFVDKKPAIEKKEDAMKKEPLDRQIMNLKDETKDKIHPSKEKIGPQR